MSALVVLVACRSGNDGAGPDAAPSTSGSRLRLAVDGPVSVPPTMSLPPDWEQPDTRGVSLRPVPGRRPPAPRAQGVALGGGSSRLDGAVSGPGGSVAGATVRVERFVEDRVGHVDVTSGAGGAFHLDGLPGGRYRVRAWSRPDLTVTRPALVFLAADHGVARAELALERHQATTMLGAVGVSRWQVGQRTGVSVLVSQEYVDEAGVVRPAGIAGARINLRVPPGISLLSAAEATTGADGYARFGIECTSGGQYTLVAESSGYTRSIPTPVCVSPPPPTTTTTAPATGSLAVGETLRIPADGPFPAGTYRATDADADARCTTMYEVLAGGGWRRDVAGPVIEVSGPVRSLRPALGSDPCTYRRTA